MVSGWIFRSGKHVAIKCMKNTFDSIDQVNNLREIQAGSCQPSKGPGDLRGIFGGPVQWKSRSALPAVLHECRCR